jgi:Fe-Mn family superoxide dismutase
MPYQLPPLTYAFNALEPHIDARTMEIHHDKHHAAYVTNLNKAVEKTEWDNRPIEELLRSVDKVSENIRTAVRNHGGGHANHSMFWVTIGPGKGGQPSGKLADAIKAQLGGFDTFKQAFSAAAAGRFGSGWAWLSVDKNKKLVVESTANQDSPLMHGNTPVLGIDVWEHAYYLLYQNRRPDYIAAFYNVVDWDAVARLYQAAAH